jgi:hypothetical protein
MGDAFTPEDTFSLQLLALAGRQVGQIASEQDALAAVGHHWLKIAPRHRIRDAEPDLLALVQHPEGPGA